MNKILLFVILLAGVVFNGHAQTKPQLNIGPEFGFPMGQASDVFGTVIGGALKLELPVKASLFSATITSGFSSYLTRLDYRGAVTNATYSNLKLGGKYIFSKIGYFEGELGPSFNVKGNYSTKNALVYAAGIGVSAPTNNHKATIDLGVRYEARAATGPTVSQIAVHLAYRFGI